MIEVAKIKNVSEESKKNLLDFIDACRLKIQSGEIDAAFFIAQEAPDGQWHISHCGRQSAAVMLGGLELVKLRLSRRVLDEWEARDREP